MINCQRCGEANRDHRATCEKCGEQLPFKGGAPAQYYGPDMAVADWVGTLLLTAIPLVGFIMLLIWAFGSTAPESKSNWAKATLIVAVIGVCLGALLGACGRIF